MEIAERFINYTKFDTQSVDESETVPSNPKQLIFARYLKEELEKEGLKEVEMDEKGYIYATLPANTDKSVPTIGFIAHYDTALDASGANIKARIVKSYDGGDIELVDVDGKRVVVSLRGRCAQCRSSEVTIRNLVERVLREHVEADIVVEEA